LVAAVPVDLDAELALLLADVIEGKGIEVPLEICRSSGWDKIYISDSVYILSVSTRIVS
jgi:hypothetical protein